MAYLNDIFQVYDSNERGGQSSFLSLLNALVARIDALESQRENARRNSKERFNLLNCLTRHHLEALHSNIIHYLLNPAADHDCGSLFLKLFIDTLQADANIGGNTVLQNLATDTSTEVKAAKELDAGDKGRIDVFVESRNTLVVIENKIYAREQDKQLLRYGQYCEEEYNRKGKKAIILYLTLYGTESSQAGSTSYYRVSYQEHIRNWLLCCIRATGDYPNISSALKNYLSLLEEKLLNITPNDILMNLKELLLQPENRLILKYHKELHDGLVSVRNHLRVEFFKKLNALLRSKGYLCTPVLWCYKPIAIDKIWNEKYGGLSLGNPEYAIMIDAGKKLQFIIEHDFSEIYCGLVPMEHGKPQTHTWQNEQISAFLMGLNYAMNGILEAPESCWFAWKLFPNFNDLYFNDDKLNYDLVCRMDEMVQQTGDEIIAYLNILRQQIQASPFSQQA